MIKFEVQFVLPVNNPENNVRLTAVRGGKNRSFHFEVPLNHPEAHNLGFADLLLADERRKFLTQSTTLNSDTFKEFKEEAVKKVEKIVSQGGEVRRIIAAGENH